ncbi:zinc knuckle CX2CX4HX4C containing protein [Tanacetum coccineum]
MEDAGNKMGEVADRFQRMKGLGAGNAGVPQQRKAIVDSLVSSTTPEKVHESGMTAAGIVPTVNTSTFTAFGSTSIVGGTSRSEVTGMNSSFTPLGSNSNTGGLSFTSNITGQQFRQSGMFYEQNMDSTIVHSVDINAIASSGSVTFDGEEVLRSMTTRRNKMTGKGDVNANASQSTPSSRHDIIFELFGVSLKTYKDFENFINNIELGKCEVWSELSKEKRQEVSDTFCAMFKALKVENPDDSMPNKASPSDPIVQPVDINTKSTSYAGATGASTKESPRVISNFRPLLVDPVFDGVNIYIPHKVVEKAGLEAVLESVPWMIRKTPIILKKWSMFTSLQKEELMRIPIWVKLHDVPLQVFEEDGISLIATFIGKPIMLDSYTSSMCKDSWGRSSFARCLIEVNLEADLVDVVTIGIPFLTGDDFTKETIRVEYEWRPPRCDECKIFGHVHDHCPKKVVSPPIVTTSNVAAPTIEKSNDSFQTVGKKKKRKGKAKSTNGGQFAGHSVKQIVRYEPKATPSAPKKGAANASNPSKLSSMLKTAETSPKKDNFTTSNSFSALNDEEEDEEVENVYDESANLFKTGGSSSFIAAAG